MKAPRSCMRHLSRTVDPLLQSRNAWIDCLPVLLALGCFAGAAQAQTAGQDGTPPTIEAPADVPANVPADLPADNPAADPAQGQALVEAAGTTGTEQQLPAYLRESGPESVLEDPWEPYNRRVFQFNLAIDKAVGRPVARAYVRYVPSPVRVGVANFFQNIHQLPTAANLLLQGKPSESATTAGRFAVNTTIGIVGLFDPATRLHIPRYREDFGQTMAKWGWHNSRYFLLPLLGPGTVRDDLGRLVDSQASVYTYVHPASAQVALYGTSVVDTRSRLLSLDDLATEAGDKYTLVREAWGQYREYEINHNGRAAGGTDAP